MFFDNYLYLLTLVTTFGYILAVNNTLNSTTISLKSLKNSFIHQKLYSLDSFGKCVSVCKTDICDIVYKNENQSQNCVYQYCENGVCDTVEKNICYLAMNRQMSWSNVTAEECVKVCGCKLPKHKMRTKRHSDNREDEDDDNDNDYDDDRKTKKEIEIIRNKKESENTTKKASPTNRTDFSEGNQYSWCTDKQTSLEDCQKDCVRDCDGPAKNGRFGRCYLKCRKQLICATLGHGCIKKCKDACHAKSALRKCKGGKVRMSSSECLGKAVTMKFLYADWESIGNTHTDETLVKRFCTSQCVLK